MSENTPSKNKGKKTAWWIIGGLVVLIFLMCRFGFSGNSEPRTSQSSSAAAVRSTPRPAESDEPNWNSFYFERKDYRGGGDVYLDVDFPELPAIMSISYSGDQNFVITSFKGDYNFNLPYYKSAEL